jgi:hypothetical protein
MLSDRTPVPADIEDLNKDLEWETLNLRTEYLSLLS